MTLGTAQLNNQLASQLFSGFVGAVPFKSIFDTFITFFAKSLYPSLSISMFEQRRVRCNQLKKMTMTPLKLLSDEEEGFPFSERHKVTQTKNNQLA